MNGQCLTGWLIVVSTMMKIFYCFSAAIGYSVRDIRSLLTKQNFPNLTTQELCENILHISTKKYKIYTIYTYLQTFRTFKKFTHFNQILHILTKFTQTN